MGYRDFVRLEADEKVNRNLHEEAEERRKGNKGLDVKRANIDISGSNLLGHDGLEDKLEFEANDRAEGETGMLNNMWKDVMAPRRKK